jgi:hypothetical protein
MAAVGAACALLTVTAGAASAAITASLGAPSLSARVAVNVPVTVSCDPFDPSLTLVDGGAFLTVEQASGRSIARGSNFSGGFVPNVPFVCDSAPHTFTATVVADSGGPPFHGGPAIISGSASADAGIEFAPGSFQILDTQIASIPPVKVNLH